MPDLRNGVSLSTPLQAAKGHLVRGWKAMCTYGQAAAARQQGLASLAKNPRNKGNPAWQHVSLELVFSYLKQSHPLSTYTNLFLGYHHGELKILGT